MTGAEIIFPDHFFGIRRHKANGTSFAAFRYRYVKTKQDHSFRRSLSGDLIHFIVGNNGSDLEMI